VINTWEAVYFKLRFTLSYRDVEELMSIRGIKVDHSTIQRWVYLSSQKKWREICINEKDRSVIVGEWMKRISK
jgi:putative transposase